MKAIEILKDIEESKWCGVKPTLSNYNLEDIKKAIKELEEYESDMDSYLDYTTGSRCTKSFNSCLGSIKSAYEKELGKIIKEHSEDRLAELEKVILDYYLAKGYRVGVGGWHFIINISTSYKRKEIQIMFRQDICSNWETVFSIDKQSTKEMFDVAFEYFSKKDTNAK